MAHTIGNDLEKTQTTTITTTKTIKQKNNKINQNCASTVSV